MERLERKKYSIEINEKGGKLSIVLSRKSWHYFIRLLLPLILLVIFIALVHSQTDFIKNIKESKEIALFFLLYVYVIGTYLILGGLPSALYKEIIIRDKEHLKIVKNYILFKTSKKYQLDEISDIRISKHSSRGHYMEPRLPFKMFSKKGTLVFDHKKSSIYWGIDIKDNDRDLILDIIKNFAL